VKREWRGKEREERERDAQTGGQDVMHITLFFFLTFHEF
jgi:hypothetical protein